jgi:transposase
VEAVWVQQYYRCDDPEHPLVQLRPTSEQPPSAQIISSPYDPEARYTTKRETSWVGYKLHLTETVRHVTQCGISAAGGSDSKGGHWVTQPT